MDRQQDYVLRTIEDRDVRFVRLWFTDVVGTLKSVALSPAEVENAFTEGLGFDGSSIDGYTRISESDMLLQPDPATFQILPWRGDRGQSSRMFCDVLTPDGRPAPADPRLVTIEVRAAGVAFPELLQTRGLYQMKPDLPFVPGAEVAGVVTAAPEGSGFAAGDRVAALTMLGGFAEVAQAQPDLTFHLPDEVGFEAGAAFTFNYATVYFALLERGHLAEGETVLVHGAAGGIGTAAIQMAKAFGAGKVIGVVSTEAKGEIARAAGADEVVLADGFLDAVGKASVDVVVDPVGGDRFTDSIRALGQEGRILVIGFASGKRQEARLNHALVKNYSILGLHWSLYQQHDPQSVLDAHAELVRLADAGQVAPLVAETYDFADTPAALARLAGGGPHHAGERLARGVHH